MDKKNYPIYDEESDNKVCEPSGVAAYSDWVDCDVPILGPSTWEEAIADLDESEREFEAGECIPWENVVGEIKERYKSYAY
jgi:hypothetical protein